MCDLEPASGTFSGSTVPSLQHTLSRCSPFSAACPAHAGSIHRMHGSHRTIDHRRCPGSAIAVSAYASTSPCAPRSVSSPGYHRSDRLLRLLRLHRLLHRPRIAIAPPPPRPRPFTGRCSIPAYGYASYGRSSNRSVCVASSSIRPPTTIPYKRGRPSIDGGIPSLVLVVLLQLLHLLR